VTGSYRRARRGRAVGKREDGFTVTATMSMGVPPKRAFDALGTALADAPVVARTRPGHRSARCDYGVDGTA